MTETFQAMDRIVALHPLPFTPANVFFISLGWLDFPHALPSSSSQFPQGFPQQTCFGVLSKEGLLKYIPDMSLAVFISPSPDSWGWRWWKQRAGTSQVAQFLLHSIPKASSPTVQGSSFLQRPWQRPPSLCLFSYFYKHQQYSGNYGTLHLA